MAQATSSTVPSRFKAIAPVAVDYWSLEGDYLGTLTWPGCPRYVSPDGTVFLTSRGQFNVPIVLGFRYAGDP